MGDMSLSSEFIKQAHESIKNTSMEHMGIRLLEIDGEKAVAEMSFNERLQQLTGLFHAGVLVALADTTATFLCIFHNNNGVMDMFEESFPFTVQLSTNFLRNVGKGKIRAEAKPVHRGKKMLVIETRISDETGRLLVVVNTTHLNLNG